MRPESEYLPPRSRESEHRVAVSCHVCLDLFPPPGAIVLWPGTMNRTTMPKAAVYEYRNFSLQKGHIWAPSSSGNGRIDAISKTHGS
jgi:hypothetical protein